MNIYTTAGEFILAESKPSGDVKYFHINDQ